MNNNPFTKLLTSLWVTVILLGFSLVIIFLGTMAQEPMGLNIAVDRFFKDWFVGSVAMEAALRKTVELFGWNVDPVTSDRILGDPGWPAFPGGYLVGGLLLINLLAAYYQRFEWSAKKAGTYISHFGIITLLVGQIATDILQEESFVDMERGDRRNYSVSFDHNEMVFMLPIEGQSNRVISIPEKMLTVGSKITHPELGGLTLEVEKYWVNAKPMTADQLVELDNQNQTDLQKGVVDQIFEVMNFRITEMEKFLNENPDSGQRSELTRLKGRFFEIQGQQIQLRVLADLLGLVGEMEMSVYGLEDNSKRLVFNDQVIRNMLIKVRAYEDQRTISNLFTEATKGRLRGCTLSQFENNATDFMIKIKDFPGGSSDKILNNTEKYVKRIKGRAKIYYAGTDQGQLGQFFRFIQPLQPVFSQNDRNLPAALLKVTNGKGKSGKYLFTCSSDFQQSVNLEGDQGEKWRAIFRPKRHYLGFDLTLVDLKWEKYRGTEIPKNFQSRVVVEDKTETRSVDIFMNNPLRKGGQTFYQFQMNQNQLGATVQTVLQVVKNPNWITAYIGCVIVSVGLLYQFIYHLVGFSRKRRSMQMK